MLTITWRETPGSKDLIPSSWFEVDGFFESRSHGTVGYKVRSTFACCSLKVLAAEAVLNYAGSHKKDNSDNGWDIGSTKIMFEDDSRAVVTQMLWMDERGKYRDEKPKFEYYEDEGLEDILYSEGSKFIVSHLARERSAKLRKLKIDSVLAAGQKLDCEACGFDFSSNYIDIGEGFCEVHHRDWLGTSEPSVNKVSDLAILCSNCHRMIHRTNRLSVEEFSSKFLRLNLSID